MDGAGAISEFPARQYFAATGIQAKGLDRLVNDPGAALRQLGEQSLNEQKRAADNTQRISPITNRSLAASLVRNGIEEAARNGGQAKAEGAANSEARKPGELSPEQNQAVQELKARDREVRAHEQAHKAVGGQYAGAISYTYQKGPDGRQYAVGGEVPIDVSPESTPEATIAKMRVVIAAALAPAEPSAADKAVAQAAQAQLMAASADARLESQAEMEALRNSEGGR